MSDRVSFKEFIFFEEDENVGGIEDGGIKKVHGVGSEERRIDLSVTERGSETRLGGRGDEGREERHSDG